MKIILLSCTLSIQFTGEFYENLALLFITAIVSGISIPLCLEFLNRLKEKRESKRRYYREILARAISEKNKVKKCRRLLRAHSVMVNDQKCISKTAYIEIMETMEDSQLEFEHFKHEMKLQTFKPPVILKDNFKTMEKYLGGVLSNFEEGNFANQDFLTMQKLGIATIEFFKDYDDEDEEERKNAPFFAEFIKPFREAQAELINQISK